jgi:hypothetical protein
MPSHHYVITPLCHHTTMPSHHYDITPLWHNTTMPSHHWAITPLSHHTSMPSHHNAITPVCHHTTMPSHHYAITPLCHQCPEVELVWVLWNIFFRLILNKAIFLYYRQAVVATVLEHSATDSAFESSNLKVQKTFYWPILFRTVVSYKCALAMSVTSSPVYYWKAS